MKLEQSRYPALVRMTKILQANHRFASDIVDRGAALFGEPWADEFEKIMNALFPTPKMLEAAVKGYAKFAMHSMRLQVAFERERQYKTKTYEQAASEVYFNQHHMMEEYLPGLLISHFLWPHHYRQLQFFDTAFVQAMRAAGAKSFIEVGVGTGLYSSFLLRRMPAICGVGLDISPSSKKFTEIQIKSFGLEYRYQVDLRDVTVELIEPKTDWLICIEVLEHLENPVDFLRALRRSMAPGAHAFITAAINAAHADHIYLYRNADDVLIQLQEAGFSLEQSFVGSAYKPSTPGAPVPEAAAFIVF